MNLKNTLLLAVLIFAGGTRAAEEAPNESPTAPVAATAASEISSEGSSEASAEVSSSRPEPTRMCEQKARDASKLLWGFNNGIQTAPRTTMRINYGVRDNVVSYEFVREGDDQSCYKIRFTIEDRHCRWIGAEVGDCG